MAVRRHSSLRAALFRPERAAAYCGLRAKTFLPPQPSGDTSSPSCNREMDGLITISFGHISLILIVLLSLRERRVHTGEREGRSDVTEEGVIRGTRGRRGHRQRCWYHVDNQSGHGERNTVYTPNSGYIHQRLYDPRAHPQQRMKACISDARHIYPLLGVHSLLRSVRDPGPRPIHRQLTEWRTHCCRGTCCWYSASSLRR